MEKGKRVFAFLSEPQKQILNFTTDGRFSLHPINEKGLIGPVNHSTTTSKHTEGGKNLTEKSEASNVHLEFKFYKRLNVVQSGYLLSETKTETGASKCYVNVDSDLALTYTPELPKYEFMITFYENYNENSFYVSLGREMKKEPQESLSLRQKKRVLYIDTTQPGHGEQLKMGELEHVLRLFITPAMQHGEFVLLTLRGQYVIHKAGKYLHSNLQVSTNEATRFKFVRLSLEYVDKQGNMIQMCKK